MSLDSAVDAVLELRRVIAEQEVRIATLTADARKWELKANQLHDFCPDHRDKQRGKPCLACEVERLRALVAVGREMADVLDSIVGPDFPLLLVERWRSLEGGR